MNYKETLEYIHSLPKFKTNSSSELKNVLQKMSNPQNNLKYVHIAGTNGKGSTAVMIQSALTFSNKKTGLYISPFVIEFCERIQIDGKFISHESLVKYSEYVKEILQSNNLKLTEFEFITAVAFKYFCNNNCDIVVLETGLGGRLDATNVIKQSLVSVITQIDIDHSEILGNTIEKIAYEKCGIIKNNSVVVTTQNQKASVKKIIENVASQKNNKLFFNNVKELTNKKISLNGNSFCLNNTLYKTKFLGEHQFDNAATALKVLEVLNVDKKSISHGLKSAYLKCRIDILNKTPTVIVDGSHNKNGVSALVNTLNSLKISNFNIIVCMMKDKDIKNSLAEISKSASHIFVTEIPENPRCIKAKDLKNICKEFNSNTEIIKLNNYKKYISSENPTVIFGSLYLASYIINNF